MCRHCGILPIYSNFGNKSAGKVDVTFTLQMRRLGLNEVHILPRLSTWSKPTSDPVSSRAWVPTMTWVTLEARFSSLPGS